MEKENGRGEVRKKGRGGKRNRGESKCTGVPPLTLAYI